ncbi:MAG: hypothetical protein JST00_12415 [Deltaproteobacteria bacterium]|nr:hypothetical protein [Deltaproteobacteria bacterium]
MRAFRRASLLAGAAAFGLFFACGDDDNIVRTRPDGGVVDAAGDTGTTDAGTGLLACGVPIPTSYESPAFAVNAKAALDLKASFEALEDKMKSTENANTAVVTASELQAIFTAGTPSLRAASTAAAQTTVDGWITAYADAMGKTWTPADIADAGGDAGGNTGGKYEGTYYFSNVGLDLREAIAKTLLNGAFYNYGLLLSSGLVTEATIDNLLALFGASTKLLNSTSADAGSDADELVAEYAALRDSKDPARPGPYQKIKRALLSAKAAAGAGEKCKADLDAALKVFFAEWERASYLTVIYYLNAAATNASAVPPKGPSALHGFGEAIGFIGSFRGVPQDRRKITDAQIDALLTRVGAATPYVLVTDTNARIVAFNGAFTDIGAIYGLSPLEIEEAKKAY